MTIATRTDALRRHDYCHRMACLNKSYAKDMEWSLALYRSWLDHGDAALPFYVVVPQDDHELFVEAFAREKGHRRIAAIPHILTEEWVFERSEIDVPEGFTGWHRQQVVKLCFSKTGLAANYLTFDSAVTLKRRIDPATLFAGSQIRTNAYPTTKADFFSQLVAVNMPGWLNGGLVGLDRSFDSICSFLGNDTADTNIYISGTGLFDADLSRDLDRYARERGLDGLVGCLDMAPYELAWYGEFVFTHHRPLFVPHGPHMLELVESEESAVAFLDGRTIPGEGRYGMMFQQPAAALIGPYRAYQRTTM